MASYVDAIGDRLDRPELVPEEYRHLIADDQQRVKRILEIPVSGHVLDVGCSDGAITKRIRDRWGVRIVGADVRPTGHKTDPVRWVRWDVREPYPDDGELFDAIYCCEVLEHLTEADSVTAITNMLAVLKRGGQMIVSVPNRHPADVYEVGCRARWAWPDHQQAFDGRKLYTMLASAFDEWTDFGLYGDEHPSDSIWLIAHATGKL